MLLAFVLPSSPPYVASEPCTKGPLEHAMSYRKGCEVVGHAGRLTELAVRPAQDDLCVCGRLLRPTDLESNPGKWRMSDRGDTEVDLHGEGYRWTPRNL